MSETLARGGCLLIAGMLVLEACAPSTLNENAAWIARKKAEIDAACTAAGFDPNLPEHYDCRRALAQSVADGCTGGRWGAKCW